MILSDDDRDLADLFMAELPPWLCEQLAELLRDFFVIAHIETASAMLSVASRLNDKEATAKAQRLLAAAIARRTPEQVRAIEEAQGLR